MEVYVLTMASSRFAQGFAQGLFALDAADGLTEGPSVVVNILVQSLLSSPDYGKYASSPPGLILYYLWNTVTAIILLNVLISLFSSAYSDVIDDAEAQYLAFFASKTIGMIRAPDSFVYPAPFNLIETFFLNRYVMGVLFFIPLTVIAFYEAAYEQKEHIWLKNWFRGSDEGAADYVEERDPEIDDAECGGMKISRVPFEELVKLFPNTEKVLTVQQERRVSRIDVQSNPINQAVRKPSRPSHASPVPKNDSRDDDDEVFQLKKPKRPAKRVVITVDSDTEDEGVPPSNQGRSSNTPTLQELIPPPKASQPSSSCSKMSKPSRLKVEVVVPFAPYTIKGTTLASVNSTAPIIEPTRSRSHYFPPSPPLIRPRQLTPIRRRGGQDFFNPPSPPSPSLTSTDLDLSFDLGSLDIADTSVNPGTSQIHNYLKPLLAECGQSTCGPIEFSSFIETFPYDRVVQSSAGFPTDLRFRKIGEASYSEVFGIGDVVLKVIPLRDESSGSTALSSTEDTAEEDGPAPTDAKDVLKEIIVTDAMGQVCDGFVKLLKTYVVRGKYPEVLLRLWDEYHTSKGSESVRPDKFLVSQIYAIIVLPNGGPDLEAYRMDAGDGDGGERVHWTPFEDEVFMGEGDYQFDVYRMMKEHNGGAWEEFRPLTNVMWLHYLAVKLIKAKRLRAPSDQRSSSNLDTAAFTEKDCYDCLMDIEEWLRTCVTPFIPKAKGKGRKKVTASAATPLSGPACAGEIVVYAVKKGWIQPVA
ncbi:hypothetical protein C0992_004609 [Termitomyces sp. T32_za158]|nr:hypothetical protein C0992_004609 [Termitomyces sp. T32_za158]